MESLALLKVEEIDSGDIDERVLISFRFDCRP
jgi:hypothetical protein